MKTRLLVALTAILFVFAPINALAVPVALELALLVDVSGSIDSGEYALQKTGYVNAFNNAGLQSLIASQTDGIAVTYIEWASSGQQDQLVGWTHLTDAASSTAFASSIAGTSRAFSGGTGVGAALDYGINSFNNGFEGSRLVIDLSGDGTSNSGIAPSGVRDSAELAGITINALAIQSSNVETYFENNVITSDGFVAFASGFDTFGTAVLNKIGREVEQVPEPGTLLLFGSGLAGLALYRRRSVNK